MIICSCNLITANSVKQILQQHDNNQVPTVAEIMEKHGCSIECATCARNIKLEIRKHYEDRLESR